jgi:hypothetical protein
MQLDEMMNELVELYHRKYTWFITYEYRKGIDGELVPYCFVLFGDKETQEEWKPLYIKNNGKELGLYDEKHGYTVDDFECACGFYESNIYDCVKYIYDEIKKRVNYKFIQKLTETPCKTCGTQRPCFPDECEAYLNWIKL